MRNNLAITIVSFCDDYLYDSPYGGKKVGRIDEKGCIYDSAYGGKKVGRVDDGYVYDDAYGGKRLAGLKIMGSSMMSPTGEKQ